MDFITWNNRPGQAEGEEDSNLRRVATTEVLLNTTFYLEIQSKSTGNTAKAYRVTSDLPEFVSGWGPTLTGARQTAVQWAADALKTKARNLLGMDWWIAIAAMPGGKSGMPTIIGAMADTARGRISVTRNGTGQWQVGRTNDLTWETEPTLTGEFQAYTEHLWDAMATAAAWLKNKQEQDDLAVLAIAKANAEAAALVKAEADAQWAREVDAEQKTSLARGELALAIANEEDAVARHILTTHPALQEVAAASGYVVTVPVNAPAIKVRADGKESGSNHGWFYVGDHKWVKEFRKLGRGVSDWTVWVTITAEAISPVDGLPLSWRAVITEQGADKYNTIPELRKEMPGIRTKTAAQRAGELAAAPYVDRNRERDRSKTANGS